MRKFILILFFIVVIFLFWIFFIEKNKINSNHPTYIPAVETIPEGEKEAIDQIKNQSIDFLKSQYQAKRMLRDAHTKPHGCVKANVEINNQKLPPELRVGIFSHNQIFPAYIRFSSTSSIPQADSGFDARGMAIKLMNVSGKKILNKELNEKTQDILLVSFPIFFQDSVMTYRKFLEKPSSVLTLLLGHPLKVFSIRSQLLDANKQFNPLFIRYWSATPYALGITAVKYSAIPCTIDHHQKVNREHPNFLREAMVETLSHSEACFHLMVQLQNDAENMPIEDPTVVWDETASPFIPVATIKIFSQTFDTEAQNQFCENLSFTPWHSLPEHRPLGGINRARKTVYEAVSSLRHQTNHIPHVEPQPIGWPQ